MCIMKFSVSVALLSFLVLALPVVAGGQQAGGSAAPATTESLLRHGDLLRIQVWPDTSLSGEFLIEETGSVYLPVIGELAVAGRPISDVRTDLRARYRETMMTPVVVVTPAFNVSVLGGVLRPGLYRLDPSVTVLDAISLAGGFTTNAKRGDIRLLRNGRVIELDAEEAFTTGGDALGVRLQSGDRIIVPEGRRDQWISNLIQASTLVVTVLNFLAR